MRAAFRNRVEAGRLVADWLRKEFDRIDCVFFLPKGGAEVAAPVALRFNCALSPVFVAKLQHPFQPECTIGAMDENGNPQLSVDGGQLALPPDAFEDAIRRARDSLFELKRLYGSFVPEVAELKHKNPILVLVDDGLETGQTAKTALRFLQGYQPEILTLAVPCATQRACELVGSECDQVITLVSPTIELADRGSYYRDFSDVEHATVLAMLQSINLKNAA